MSPQRLQSENDRFRALLSLLPQAIVAVDEVEDSAMLNEAASRLLGMPAREAPAREVTAAIQRLASQALNPEEVRVMAARLSVDPEATIGNTVWLVPAPVRYLRVSTQPLAPSSRIWVFDDVTPQMDLLNQKERLRAEAEAAHALLRASIDGMLDPQILLEPLRNDEGAIVDFVHLEANRAACSYMKTSRGAMLGRSLIEMLPGLGGSGLLQLYIDAMASGEPLAVDGFVYDNEVLASSRRYDIRASRIGQRLSVTWRDVTERHEAARRTESLLRESEHARAESEAARADAVRAEAVVRAKNLELEEALTRVKTLEGFIHICMYCKKIRNDAQEWDRLEEYLGRHSDTRFSHGVCPRCYEKALREGFQ